MELEIFSHLDVDGAVVALQREHTTLNELLVQIRQAQHVVELTPLLNELHPMLMEHFGHEEFPGGLYQRLGATASAYSEDLRKLLDEHFRFLSMCHGLIRSANHMQPNSNDHSAALLGQAQRLVEALYAHETRELQLALTCASNRTLA